jgi:hypothetical protein
MVIGKRLAITLNSQASKTNQLYENSLNPLADYRRHPSGHLGRSLEVDRLVEECSARPIGLVRLPGHLQYRGRSAHSLHFVLSEK